MDPSGKFMKSLSRQLHDAEKWLNGLVLVGDVTERKRAEEALRQSEEEISPVA